MEHPFEYRAHFNAKGEPCHCPWGFDEGGEHLGSIKESSKLQWLEGRPDMQQERNQFWLQHMKDKGFVNNDTDKLLPWLHREYKKGRLLPGVMPHGGHPNLKFKEDGSQWTPDEVVHRAIEPGEERSPVEKAEGAPWAAVDHLGNTENLTPSVIAGMQAHLEEMKKRGKGVDVMQHKVHELMPKIKDFRDWKQSQDRKDLGEPIHRFDDGWTIRQLQNREEMEDEGDQMGHCIGTDEHGCPGRQEDGTSVFASLRDPNNFPHATMEVEPREWEHNRSGSRQEYNPEDSYNWTPRIGRHSILHQFYGKEDSLPLPEYVDRMSQWYNPLTGTNLSGLGTGEGALDEPEPYVDIPGAENTRDYLGIEGDDGNWMEYAPEDQMVGEHTEYRQDPHDFDAIARDYLTGKPLSEEHQQTYRLPGQEPLEDNRGRQPDWGDRAPTRFEPPPTRYDRREVFDTAHNKGHEWDMESALEQNADPNNIDHQKLLEEWYGWADERKPKRVLEEAYGNPMVTENYSYKPANPNGKWERNPDGTVKVDKNRDMVPAPPIQGPWQEQWKYPTYSSVSKPLYYRWIFSPSKGVTLGSNQDNHPALVKYHQALGGDINDTDLSHGYASPIGNGWRVSDLDHQPVGDPYIVQQVVRRLNAEESPEIRSEGSWRPLEYDWDRLHYGLPREKVGSF